MGQPVHKYLEEFPSDDPQPPDWIVHRLRLRVASAPPAASPMGGRLGEVYARGLEEGQVAGRAQVESDLAALQADYEHRLEKAKSVFSQTVAEQLSGELRHRVEMLHSTLAEQVVSALLPVLRHTLTEATIRELADGLRMLVGDGEAVSIELSGPEELVERVWHRYCELEGGQRTGPTPEVRFSHGATTEVRMSVNDAVIELRLMEWIARIVEAVG